MEANEAVKIEADLAKAQALTEREHAAAIRVTSPEDYRVAVETLKQCSAKHREIDAQRKRATKPLDEAKRTIMDWFRPAIDNLDSAISAIRKAIATYEAYQRRREEAAATAYANAMPEMKDAFKTQLVRAFEGSVEKIDGVQKRTVWKFEVTDQKFLVNAFTEMCCAIERIKNNDRMVSDGLDEAMKHAEQIAALLPYVSLDEKKVGAVVRAMKGEVAIPGVRVYAETVLAIEGKGNDDE